MRTLGRILLGAFLALLAATFICALAIVALEYGRARGWTDDYDDATLALLMQVLLTGAPIVGGWWAWTRGGVSRDT